MVDIISFAPPHIAPAFLAFGFFRAYVMECSGMAITRGNATSHDISQHLKATHLFGDSFYRALSGLAAVLFYVIGGIILVVAGWNLLAGFVVLSVVGVAFGVMAYKRVTGRALIAIAVPAFYIVAGYVLWEVVAFTWA